MRRPRIIPARAGFTTLCSLSCRAGRDHPRSRGVYRSPPSPARTSPGSSPLARGLQGGGYGVECCCRIIPARAGFTRAATGPPSPAGDHPRSRGVYNDEAPQAQARFGSSPLARGLRRSGHADRHLDRIIPARAGFTLADPWNPNDEPHYQTAFAFTADLVLAPQSSDSAVVSQRSTRTPSEA